MMVTKRSKWSKLLIAGACLGTASTQVKAADTLPPNLLVAAPTVNRSVYQLNTDPQSGLKELYGNVYEGGNEISGVARVTAVVRRYSDGYYWDGSTQSWTAASASLPAILTQASGLYSFDWVVNNGPNRAGIDAGVKYLVVVSAVDKAGNVSRVQRDVYGID